MTKSKSSKRIESKKKKMAALVEITKLNEYDRRRTRKKQMERSDTVASSELEPSLKKQKTESRNNESGLVAPAEPPEIGTSGKPKLTGEAYRELKRRLRERTLMRRHLPMFELFEKGNKASIKTDVETRVPLHISDLQALIFYAQLGNISPYSLPGWCSLIRFNRLNSTCVLVIEKVALKHYQLHNDSFSFLNSKFDTKLEILPPGKKQSDLVKELSMVSLTTTQMRPFCEGSGPPKTGIDTVNNFFPIANGNGEQEQIHGLPPGDCFPRTQLLLSGWQLIEENFPLPVKGLMETKYAGYVLTKDKYEKVTPFSKMFGVDCEMCKTTIGDLELTRVSVVDEQYNIFYDTLVKPKNKITDYLTQFSGITPRMMRGVTTTLEEVQQDLRRLLPSDAILVGQSLSNDMHALKLMHPYVIDTSVIFNVTGERSRKTKLKTLMEKFLSEKIQEGKAGHCSTEDSMASLKLTKFKLTKNIYFGDAVMSHLDKTHSVSAEPGKKNKKCAEPKKAPPQVDKPTIIVGLNDTSTLYKSHIGEEVDRDNLKLLWENSCKDVAKKMNEVVNTAPLVMGHMQLKEGQLEGTKIFRHIDKWVTELYDKLLLPGLFIVFFAGCEDSNGCCFIKLKRDLENF